MAEGGMKASWTSEDEDDSFRYLFRRALESCVNFAEVWSSSRFQQQVDFNEFKFIRVFRSREHYITKAAGHEVSLERHGNWVETGTYGNL